MAERYGNGRSLLFPDQVRRLRWAVEVVEDLPTMWDEHLRWLAYGRAKVPELRLELKHIQQDLGATLVATE